MRVFVMFTKCVYIFLNGTASGGKVFNVNT